MTDVAQELAALSAATLAGRPGGGDGRPDDDEAAPGDVHAPSGTGDADLAVRLLGRALRLVPAADRRRYQAEWTADLATLAATRQRLAFAAGLLYSARSIRRTARGRGTFPRPTR